MSRVVVLGMDGMDPYLIEKWWDELPNLRKLRDKGAFMKLDSVYPPDSIPAWAAIYTGLTPDYHGILDSIDYVDLKGKKFTCDVSGMRDRTFWDKAGRAGKRVCVVNPFLAYPVWPVNGIMINGPVFVTGEVQSHPPEILDEYEIPELGGIVDNPTKDSMGEFADGVRKLTSDFIRFGSELMDREKWDLFFINFLGLDRVQHFFWRYHDTEDPTYPGNNRYSDVIKGFYVQHDEAVGRFLEKIDGDTVLIVHSDHGHGRRCTKMLNVNEFLRRNGFLKSRVSGGIADPRLWLERMKAFTLRTLDRYELQDWAYRIGRMIPGSKGLKKSTYVIDKGGSRAGIGRFSGMNPFGGIEVSRDNFEGGEYDKAVESIIEGMREVEDPKTGKKVVKWIRRREEMFSGPKADIYPEIIFRLDPDYGVGRNMFGPIIDINPSHRKVSGGHMPEAAFLCSRQVGGYLDENSTVRDIGGLILSLLDVGESA